MALNFRKFLQGIQIVPKTTSTVSAAGDLDFDTTSDKLNLHNGTDSSHVVTETQSSEGADRLQNKDLDASNVRFVDPTDTSKEISFEDAGATTNTTLTLHGIQTVDRDITFPDQDGYLVVSGSPGIITNNILDESSVWFVDTVDNTKALKFDSSGATTGTATTLVNSQTANRDLTLPDATDTLVARDTTDTLTNKTLTSPVLNTPTADTITGIAGGPLALTSANNQNLNVSAPGTGRVHIELLEFNNNSISGDGSSQVVINSPSQDLVLAPGTSNAIQLTQRAEITKFLSYDILNDGVATGSNATLSALASTYVRLTNVSLASVSAIPAGFQGQVLALTNATGNSITINNEDTGVTAANRILTGTGSSITLNNDTSINLIYDSASARWRVTGSVGGPPKTFGSRGTPRNIVAANGIIAADGQMSPTEINQVIFLQGNGGPITVSASPAIQVGTIVGQKMTLIGRSNTNTVTLTNVSGQLEMNGDVTLGLSDVLDLIWDGTAWVETSRN